jgi:hypothetical protein
MSVEVRIKKISITEKEKNLSFQKLMQYTVTALQPTPLSPPLRIFEG